MTGLLEQIAPEYAGGMVPKFRPGAKYDPDMDMLLYLQEPCSFRADRVDGFLTLLWHPRNDRMIGVKLKGWRKAFTAMKEIPDWKEEAFFPLVKALEFGLAEIFATAIMENFKTTPPSERYKLAKKYSEAIQFVRDVAVPARELAMAA